MKNSSHSRKTIDIKFGEGGLQDVYFAIRYLQLRHNLPDDANNRTSIDSLQRLRDAGCINLERYMQLLHGYRFLSELDHFIRLTSGRSARLPAFESEALKTITERMNLDSPNELLAQLTLHRHNVRDAFSNVLK